MIDTDKFPEAFSRFERTVNTKDIRSFDELRMAFASWAGEKWRDTSSQRHALTREARRIGIPVEGLWLRRKVAVPVSSRAEAERRFSARSASYGGWSEKSARSSAYERRISNYMKRHPDATLREARGHRNKGR